MRIVIDGRMILPEMSGIGRYILELSRALAGLDSDLSFELWLQDSLPEKHPAYQIRGARMKVRRVPVRHMSLRGHLTIPSMLRASMPDLFHYPHFDLPLTTPGRIVLTIHDLKYLAEPRFFPHQPAMKRLGIRLLMGNASKRAEKIICDSRSTRDSLIHQLNIPAEKLRVIPLGVEGRFFVKASHEEILIFRSENDLTQPYLLFVGERRPHKNLVGLIEAFAIFRQETNLDTRLVIAGRAYSDYQAPEQAAARLGLIDVIRFIGHIPEEKLPLLYQSAEALVLPSYYEGFGLPVLEAMASGTPVIASDRTSLPEVAGEAGLLVPPDDPQKIAQAMASLVQSAPARADCIARGLEQAAQFTWSRCAEQTLQVYREVLTA